MDLLLHIPDTEIMQDMADTQREIDNRQAILVLLMRNPPENKLEIFKAENYISQRQVFINKLKELLHAREVAKTQS